MILVTGGARSGKSRHCEQQAALHCEQILYIATSVVADEEMAARVACHRADRPAHWRTWEGFEHLGDVIRYHRQANEGVMLECMTTMIANLMYQLSGDADIETLDFAPLEHYVNQQVDDLIDACQHCSSPIFIVTNELGMSVTPENRLARHFVDIAGRVNQKLAQAADSVWLVVSGIGVKIK